MRIAHITATFPPYYSGTGMVCYNNAIELAKRGHTVTIWTADYLIDSLEQPMGVEVRRLKPWFRFGNAPFLAGLLKIKDYDIIHLHHPFIWGSELTCAVSHLRRIPYVITHHNDLIEKGGRGYLFDIYSRLATPAVFGSAQKIAVVSLDHAQHSRLAYLFSKKGKDNVVEIPNGVDVNRFRPDLNIASLRAVYHLPDTSVVVLFVGTLDRAHHYRRVDLLLKAVAQVNNRALHLVLAGGGDLAYYKQLASNLGISEQVTFLGSVPNSNLPRVYNTADIVVLPSQLQEAFPLVILEALACGKPAIVSNLPGVRSMVTDGVEGLLVKPGDVIDLAEKLLRLLDNPQLRQEMGRRGRAKIEANYAWSKVVDRLENMYLSVI